MELQAGTKFEVQFTVTPEQTAKVIGSGTLDVLATPIMIAYMEQAAWRLAAADLDEGQGTVGTKMDAAHLSPTPVGMQVTCCAKLLSVEGRLLRYQVTAWDACGQIGIGQHERVIIQNEKFQTKAQGKLTTEKPQ